MLIAWDNLYRIILRILHYPALCGKFNIRHRYSPEGEMCCSATRIVPPRCTSARKPAELCSAGFPFQRKISNYSLGIGTALKNAEMVAQIGRASCRERVCQYV